jgi:hypothetical protein
MCEVPAQGLVGSWIQTWRGRTHFVHPAILVQLIEWANQLLTA